MKKIGVNPDALEDAGFDPVELFTVGVQFLQPKMFIQMGVDPERLIIGMLAQYGLDILVGGYDQIYGSPVSIVGMITSVMSMIPAFGKVINYIPVIGPMFYDEEGNMVGIPKKVLINVIGFDGKYGIIGDFQSYFNGETSLFSAINSLNPFTIMNVSMDIL